MLKHALREIAPEVETLPVPIKVAQPLAQAKTQPPVPQPMPQPPEPASALAPGAVFTLCVPDLIRAALRDARAAGFEAVNLGWHELEAVAGKI